MLKASTRICWMTIAFITIAMAFVVSVARLFFPLFEQYRAEVERWASKELDRPVKVKFVTADWSGMQPRLRVRKVIVYTPDGKQEWVRFDEVQVFFNVLKSVRQWRVRPGKINLVGPEIDIEYRKGQYFIGGKPLVNREIGHSRLLNWLLQREKLVISNGRVRLKDPRISHETLRLHKVNFLLSFLPSNYHMSGSFRLRRQTDSRFFFIANLEGDFLRLDKMKRKFYFAGSANIGNWLNKKLLANTVIKEGAADFRVWGNGIGRLQNVYGDVDFEDIHWTRDTRITVDGTEMISERPFSIEKLSGNFSWTRRKRGWSAVINNITWTRQGQTWPYSRIDLEYDKSHGQPRIRGQLSFARLEDIGQLLLSVLPVKHELRNKLVSLGPSGDISKLNFELVGKPGAITDYYVKLDFNRLGIRAWGRVPGISQFRGTLEANRLGGYVRLGNRKSAIELPRLFSKRIELEGFTGVVEWKKTSDGYRVEGKKLKAWSRYLRGTAGLVLNLRANNKVHLKLNANFGDGDISHVGLYLPSGIMKPRLVKWLTSSLVRGRVSNGVMKFEGDVKNFPFDKGDGVFDIGFDIKGLDLQYHKKWPAFRQMNTRVRFFGKSLGVQIHSGRVFGLEMMPTRAGIPTLGKNATLKFDGALIGPTEDMIRYMKSVPAVNEGNEFLSQFESGGRSITHVSLTLPLRELHKRSFAGRVELFDSSFVHKKWKVRLGSVNGELTFASKDKFIVVNARRLTAKYGDKPVEIGVQTHEFSARKQVETHVSLSLKTGFDHLLGSYGKALRGMMKGETSWIVDFNVRQFLHARPRVNLRINSGLQGVRVRLPGIFGKSAKRERLLQIEAQVSGEKLGVINIVYGDLLHALFAMKVSGDTVEVDKGEVRFGGGKAKLPDQSGIRMVGTLKKFSVSGWLDWADRRKQLRADSSNLLHVIRELDLRFGQLELVGNRIHQVSVKGSRQVNRWHLHVDGKEMKGNLQVPVVVNKTDPLIIDLSLLKITETEDDRKRKVPDPREMPPILVRSKEFYYNNIYHGKLSLSAKKIPDGLKFTSLHIDSKYLQIKAKGDWRVDSGLHRSKFRITAVSNDLGKALARRKYDVNIRKGRATVDVDAYWIGPPSWFRLKIVKGTMNVSIRKGRILDLKTGAGRMFGMFSLQALPRRLALDFRDVFRKGFSFDRITGAFQINNGDAYTGNLVMDSPALKIEIKGRVGLANRDYEQLILVTPKVSSNLPVVGGIAAGPGVGVGLWVADKMFGKKINRMTTRQYSLEGTWDKPIVKKLPRKRKKPVVEDDAYEGD